MVEWEVGSDLLLRGPAPSFYDKQLTSLNLSFTAITDAGLKELAKLQKLSTLDLSSTLITDVGIKEVAKLQQLTYLDLRYTPITDAGVAELQKALPKCRISHDYEQ